MATSKRAAKAKPSRTSTKQHAKSPAKPAAKAPKRKAATTAGAPKQHKLSLGVDAGNITLADMDYLIANGVEDFKPHPDDAGSLAILSVRKGTCALRVRIDTDPRIDERLELDTPSGRLFVGDVGNAFADSAAWQPFLKKTKLLTVRDRRMRSFHTGSDGEFTVTLEISPLARGR